MNNKKKIILGSIIGVFIGLILGTTYAIFSYSKVGDNQQLITGDIYMHYKESNTLTIENALPSSTYDPTKYFEFTIEGKNTNTKYNIVYDINLNYGDNINNKTRIEDRFLKFRLVEVVNNEEQELLTDKTYLSIDNKRIYVGTINKNQTTEITKTYRLYMWIDKSVVIGNTDYADYSITDWNNVYGSVKVSVTGDFSEKTIQTEPYLVLKNLNGIQAWTNIRANVTSIEFHSDGIVPNNVINTIDVTDETSNGDITLYTVDDGLNNNTYKAIVVSDDVIYAPENSRYLFRGMTNLITFNSKNFRVDNATNINGIFAMCSSLISINSISSWNTLNVSNMGYLFRQCYNLTDISALANWNTLNVSNMGYLFMQCYNLTDISALANWDTSNVTNMAGIFRQCTNLSSVLSIKNWNVEKVKDMSYMFYSCINIEEIDLSNWKTTSLTGNSMYSMFGMWNNDGTPRSDSKLKKIILSNDFNTSNVTSMYALFANNTLIDDYSFLEYLDTKNVQNMSQMFQFNYNLTNISGLANWNVSNVTDMNGLFRSCTSLTDVSVLYNWGTKIGKVEDMSSMFYDVNISSYLPFANWNVSKVQNFSNMFNQTNASTVTTLAGLENWNVSSATNMSRMFWDNFSLTDASAINNWNIKSSIDFTEMFQNAPSHPEFTKVQGTWDSNGTFTPNA